MKLTACKYVVAGWLVFSLAPAFGATQTTTVDWSNYSSTNQSSFTFKNSSGAALSQGSASVNQDGDLVELGYFSAGTAFNPFAGTWIALTTTTTIGDSSDLSGSGAGVVNFNTFFSLNSSTVNVYIPGVDAGAYTTSSSTTITSTTPATGQVLAIRFFNSINAGGSYNTVSSATWLWETPSSTPTTVDIDLTTSTLVFQDASHPFETTLTSASAVPEPSTWTLCLAGFGLGGLTWRLRRRPVQV